jgi:UDP-galactopyranose mutase
MSRFAKHRRVFFIEEPVREPVSRPHIRQINCERTGVTVLTPVLMHEHDAQNLVVKQLLHAHLQSLRVSDPVVWFYSPMWLDSYPKGIAAAAVVYDCMDELSLFKGAPPRLQANELELMEMADLVFTGGISLFEYKRNLHTSIFPFPSGVDVAHFAKARAACAERQEHANLPHPRLGFAGVIDERIDLDLLRDAAQMRSDWNFILIGPVVKIDPASLPQANNLHWLGMKGYQDLPSFFAAWDVAIMPFAINDATRFISPTKTPEFLSAGLPVVSTPVRDVVRPYGELGLARIAGTAEEFVAACEQAMAFRMGLKWRERADAFLETMSWDSVWSSMNMLVEKVLESRAPRPEKDLMARQGEPARV